MRGRCIVQNACVELRIALAEQQMDLCWLPVTSRTTSHLVELHFAERQVVQHHMANAGNVDPFAKGRGCHQHLQAALAEQRFHALSLGAREARVVETDKRGNVRLLLAEAAG